MSTAKIESALERAFAAHAHESHALDAALIARTAIKHFGDGDAARVLELARKIAEGTTKELDAPAKEGVG